jgi:hypothetical protein
VIGKQRRVGCAHRNRAIVGRAHPTLLAAVLCLVGCGATQLSSTNRHLLEALQTAVSAKNEQWLDGVAKQVEDQRGKGQLSGSEHKVLASVIDLAKAGKWDAAQSRVFALSEAQRPTAEDLARVQKRATKK